MNAYLVKILQVDTQETGGDSEEEPHQPELAKLPSRGGKGRGGFSHSDTNVGGTTQGNYLLDNLNDSKAKKLIAEKLSKQCPGIKKKRSRLAKPPNGMTEEEAIQEQMRLIEQAKQYNYDNASENEEQQQYEGDEQVKQQMLQYIAEYQQNHELYPDYYPPLDPNMTIEQQY